MKGLLIPSLVAAILLSGCDSRHSESYAHASSAPIPSPTVAQSDDGKFTPNEIKACRQSGGKVVKMGLLQTQYCIHNLADGGKSCSDKSDCIGLCTSSEWPLDVGVRATGKCQPDDGGLFGCYSEIDNGKVLRSICAD